MINEATADIAQDRLPCTAHGGWLKMSVNCEGLLLTEDAAFFQAMTADHGPLRSRTVITAVDRHYGLGRPTC